MMTREDLLLSKLSEEAGEVVQDVSKCQHFGPDEIYAPVGKSNAERVAHEIQDLIAVAEMLQAEGVLPTYTSEEKRTMRTAKQLKVEEYLEYVRKLGRLSCPQN